MFVITLAIAIAAWGQESLGHKLPGALGLDAARLGEPGIHVANRAVFYDAISLRDRHGGRVAAEGFDLDVFADAVGAGVTVAIGPGLHLGLAFAAPFARVSLTVDEATSYDRSGLASVYVEPLLVGWRWAQVDLLATYGFYAPTDQLGGEGLASPQWAHQLSTGGTVFFEEDRRWRASLRLSYDLHERKLGIDVRRGDLVQLQGGIGGLVLPGVDAGIAGFALWQISDDRGSELPASLRGRRDRAFGLGPEVNLLVPDLGAKVGLRYLRDFGVKGRAEGQILVASLTFRLASLAR